MKLLGWGLVGLVGIAGARALAAVGFALYQNPRVEREIREDPTGERAKKVMLLTLLGGRTIPANYLEEDGRLYAGADGRWWSELDGDPRPVEVLVRGETRRGRARAVGSRVARAAPLARSRARACHRSASRRRRSRLRSRARRPRRRAGALPRPRADRPSSSS